MLLRRVWRSEGGFLDFFTTLTLVAATTGIIAVGIAMIFFRRVTRGSSVNR